MFNDKFEVEESFTIDSVHNSFQCHKIIQPAFLIQSSEPAFFDQILNTLSTFHKQQFNSGPALVQLPQLHGNCRFLKRHLNSKDFKTFKHV